MTKRFFLYSAAILMLGLPLQVNARVITMTSFPPNAGSPVCPARPSGFNPPWPQRLDCREPIAGGLDGAIKIDDESSLSKSGLFIVKGPGDIEIAAKSCSFPDSYKILVRDDVTSLNLKCSTLTVGKGVKIMLMPVKEVNAGIDSQGNRLVRLYYCSEWMAPKTTVNFPAPPPDVNWGKGQTGVTGETGAKGKDGIKFSIEADNLIAIQSLWIDTSGCDGSFGGPGGIGGRGGNAVCKCFAGFKGGDGGDGGPGGQGGQGGSTSKVSITIRNVSESNFYVSTANRCLSRNDIPIVNYGAFELSGHGGGGAFPSEWPEAKGIFVWGSPGNGGIGGGNGPGGEGGKGDVCCLGFRSEDWGAAGAGNPKTFLIAPPGEAGICSAVTVSVP